MKKTIKKVRKQKEPKMCEICLDRKIKTFMHLCPSSDEGIEVTGCPLCDDCCGFCGIDKGNW